MKVLLVVNPSSGNGGEIDFKKLLEDEAKKIEFSYQIYHIKPGNDEAGVKKEIAGFKPTIVACAGGDGTVNFLAKLLAGTPISLLIIPCGSANGMAKELQIDGRIPEAFALLSKGKAKKIDLLKVNGTICVHLADVGLNARIVKRFSRDKKRGIITYAKHLLNEVFLIKHYRFFIKEAGNEKMYKAVSLTFANASQYGTGAVINSEGKLDDGIFELVIVKPFPRIQLLSIAWKMFTGKLNNSEYVTVLPCRDAEVRCTKKTTLQVDGEVIAKVNKIRIEMLPGALSVIVPPGRFKT